MQRLRRLLVAVALLGGVFVLALWLAWLPLVDAVRRRIEPVLTATLDMPVRIESARVTLRPPRIEIGGVTFGEAGAALRLRHGRLTVRVMESLRRGELMADLDATDVDVAPQGFAGLDRARHPETAAQSSRSFTLRRVRATNLRVRLTTARGPVTITARDLAGRLHADAAADLLQSTLRVRAIQLTGAGRPLDLDRAHVELEYADGEVFIPAGIMRGPEVELRVHRDRRLGGHRVRGSLDVAALEVVDPELRQWSGTVRVNGTVTGPLREPTIEADLQAPQLRAADQTIEGIDAHVRLNKEQLELVASHAWHATGTYSATGTLDLSGAMAFGVKGEWAYRSAAETTVPAAVERVPPLLASARIAARGTLTPLLVEGDVTGALSRASDEGDTVQVAGRGTLAGRAAQATVTATQASGNRIEASMSADAAGSLNGAAQARVAHMPSWQRILGAPVTPEINGVLNAEARLSGTRERPHVHGSVRGRDLGFFGTSISVLEGEVASDLERAQLERLVIRLQRGAVSAAGTIALRAGALNDWRVAVEDLPTQTLAALVAAGTGVALPLWGGQFNAHASGSGDWSAVALRGSARLDEFYLQREPLAHVEIDVESLWPRWTVNGRVEHGPEEHLSVALQGTALDSLNVSLQTSRWDLRRVQTAMRSGLSGYVELSATATGAPTALAGRLHLGAEEVEWAGRPLGAVRLDANGQAGEWRLQGQIGDRITTNGTLQTRGDIPLRATVDWRDADLAPFVRPDPNVRVDSTGSLEIQVPLRTPRRIDGTLHVDRLDVTGAEGSTNLLALRAPVVVVAHAGRFEVRSFDLGGGGTTITATGWFNSDGACDLGVEATSDLAVVEALSPAVYAARGNTEFNGRIRRAVGAPLQLYGYAHLERVALDMGSPVVVVNVNGQMSFHNAVIEIQSLSGRLAGGTFAVDGVIDVWRGPALTWTATELAPAVVPNLEAEVSGRGSLNGTWSELSLAGEIEVTRGLYNRRFALTDLIPLFHEQLAKPRSKERPATVLRVDLHVFAPDELFIDNNVAKIEMRGDLHLTGTIDDVVLAGPIEVLNGEVQFRGRTFTVTTGIVEFRPELGRQAYLNINAQTVIPARQGTYTVETHVVGTTNDYRVTFTSDDPTLSQMDLVSLVTFGKTVAELQEGGGGVSFNDVLALAPGLYKDQAEERAQSLLRVDRIELEPGYSKSTGLYEPRVTLGKNLTENLSASLSSTFGTQRRQKVQLEYGVSPRVSLLGDWESATTDQAGAFGGGVKFRYPFRTFPGWTALLPWPGEDVQ